MKTRHAAPFVLLIACAELPPIAAEICGNGILETGEDCDGAADPARGPDVRCGREDDEVEARRCRFTCDAGATCPVGFACGADGACRAPSARFTSVDQTPIVVPFGTVRAEDVDGDGVIDLMGSGSGRFTVRYGDGSGRFDAMLTSVAPTDVVPVTTADFDLNGTLDIVYGFAGVWLARTTRERRLDRVAARIPVPGVFPGGFRGLSLNRNIAPGARRDHALITLSATEDTFVQAVFPGISAPVLLPEAVYHRLDELTEVPVANIDDVPGQVEDDYALAFRGEDEIWIYGLTPDIAPFGGAAQLVLRATVSLDGLGVVDRGTHFGDIDGDGKVDLMISLRDGDQTAIAIAKGNGRGVFTDPVIDPRFTFACAERPNCNPWPLAVGDINLDGRADFVMQDHILITRANGAYRQYSVLLRDPWTRAIIADLNGDGWPDVAVSSTTTGVDLFIGDGLGYFTFAFQTTRGVPVALVAGDFDGDLITDLGVAETSPEGVTDVSVMFGAKHEIPGAAIHQASFTGFLQLFSTQTLSFFDIADELLVLTEDTPGVHSVALLIGTFIRVMVAPFRLQDPAESFFFAARNLVAGRFDADERPDVIAFTTTSTGSAYGARIFFLRGDEGEILDAPTYDEAIDFETSVGVEQFDANCSLLTAGDFDGDGTDELIGLSDSATCIGTDPLRVLHASFVPDFQPRLRPIEAGLTEPIELTTTDVDADGHLDLIIVFRGTAATATTRQNAGVIIFYGSAAGLTFEAPLLVQTADVGFDPISVAALQTDSDPELELAILTGDGLLLADATEPRRYTTGARPLANTTAEGGHVVSADVDDDGLDDLIMVTEIGARVLLAVPAPAGER